MPGQSSQTKYMENKGILTSFEREDIIFIRILLRVLNLTQTSFLAGIIVCTVSVNNSCGFNDRVQYL